MTINVEYNQLDPLLKSTPAGGDVADTSGFSPFPGRKVTLRMPCAPGGNINVLVFQVPSMAERLESTGGVVPEFVWLERKSS